MATPSGSEREAHALENGSAEPRTVGASKAIEAEALVRDFGKARAVDGVSFAVEAGEVFGFLGPNGAGKTTTVRMLTMLLAPTAGRVIIGGFDAARQPYRARRLIGLVPEESNVYTELSGWDNLMFSARLYRVPGGEREKRATELLRAFGLYEKRQAKAQVYSKGMRRRLTIAMALIHEPAILFLDEPTSGLDVQSALQIKQVVRDLNARGTTVFLTTHQIEEANQLCDRVAIINRGRLAAVDSPERLKQALASVQAVEVAFGGGGPWLESILRRLPGVTDVAKHGDKWRLYTPEPPALLPLLFDLAGQRGQQIVSLNTLGPSLEDVFLRLTGQRVGEQGAPAGGEASGPGRGRRGKGGGHGV
ncbi:MAG: ABC transporter ATP-binding protein [Chloroflexota bacterium]